MITAPIGGVVVQRQLSPGQVISSLAGGGGTPMFTIADLRTVWVVASVNEADVAGLSVGQAVEVKVLAMPDRTFRSRIAWVSSAIDPATHRVSVRAELENPDLVLKPQMSATVHLLKAGARDVIAIARSAVVYDGERAHCYVVDHDQGLSVRAVQVGRVQGPQIEIVSGLHAGERIVTRGALFIDQPPKTRGREPPDRFRAAPARADGGVDARDVPRRRGGLSAPEHRGLSRSGAALVDIITQSPGQSAEEIERYLTIPVEVQMAGIPSVSSVRTTSLFGLSDVKVQFSYDLTHEQAEQLVINRLAQMPAFAAGVQPQISPTSPIGEIYRYRLQAPAGFSVTELKTLQDWILQRRFKAIAGVIDVTCWGGRTKAYEITVDQARLAAQGVTIAQVLTALNGSNANVGGQTLNLGPQSVVVRGVGLIRSTDDVLATMVAQNHGLPVRLRDVATVSTGFQRAWASPAWTRKTTSSKAWC